jgi:CSLREA domain-containing protein
MDRVRRQVRIGLLAVLAVLLAPFAFGVPALAQTGGPTYVVNTTTDAPDASATDGLCKTAAGTCSLRAAVAQANQTTGAQITVPAGAYILNNTVGTDTGRLKPKKPMTIVGVAHQPGSGATTIDGNGTDRVFEVLSTGVVLDGLVITHGAAGKSDGGAILVAKGNSLTVRNSTITGNTSTNGAGIELGGTVTVDRSTVNANTASARGGGFDIASTGSLTVSNSTVDGNSANGGGGVNSAGTAVLNAVTVTANNSNNSNGGGIARNGGSFNISGSILAGNIGGTTGRDCSGSAMFAFQNIVQSTPGCNPSGTPLTIADPKLGPLADNGGPTLSHLPIVASPGVQGSPAIDAYAAPCVTTVDQRNVSRTPPPGGKCDIGSIEIAPLSVNVSLAASAPSRTNPPCPTGVTCVGSGVSQVPLANIPTSALVANTDPTKTADPALMRSILMKSILMKSILMKSILMKSISPALSLTLGDLLMKSIDTQTNPLGLVTLSQIPLTLPDGGSWPEVLAGTKWADVPLQSVTLLDVIDLPQVSALTLGQADLGSTSLGDLSGVAVALSPLSIADLPINGSSDLTGWCTFLAGQLAGGCASLGIDPANPSTASQIGLVTLQLEGVDMSTVPLETISLGSSSVDASLMKSILMKSILMKSIDVSASLMKSILMKSIGPIDALVDCTKIACDGTVTLAQAQAAGAIRDTATVADLLAYLAAQPGGLNVSLADLMLSLIPAIAPNDAPAYQNIDLRATPLQNLNDPPQTPVTYTATLTVGGGAPANTTFALTLPPDFEPVAGSATFDGQSIPDGTRNGQTLTFQRSGVTVGQHSLTVAARAGVDLGTKTASVQVNATSGAQSASASASTDVLVVVEAFEKNNAPDDYQQLDPSKLYVAQISSAYDVDRYTFYISPDEAASGTTAHLDLANLPADYDLVLFGPASAPLRGTPKQHLDAVKDDGLSLQPSTDQVAPDVQSDVLRNAPSDCGVPGTPQPCAPYAVSAQRGLQSESIDSGSLIPGTYWAVVQGYNGAFSDAPYDLRLQLAQGTPLGACAPRTPSPASAGPVATYPSGVTAATSTGYILLPAGRLLQQYGASATQPVIDGVNQVAAASSQTVVRVDADPGVKAAYDAWDAQPCSVDRSNDVVRAIGKVLDGLDQVTPGAKNVTIIGNHDMLPMGLVPDGTAVANENTYDPGVTFGQDSALSAALKAGYVMTDTPYATSAGYAIDASELYVPDRAVGRLVEDPSDIAAALNRFVQSNGVLDPATTSSAFVTGYDFLADGAQATANVLAGQPGTTVNSLINETWTKADLKAGLIGGNPDIASLSGHFDHNRALPALGNSTNDESDLFTTSDVAGAGNLTNALVLSIGCHSGLSVPDVELALNNRVDWAQTFAHEGATFIGNSGYGYGDSDLILYSEKLQVLFAQEMRTGASTGAAMMAAKQAYFSELAAISPYDMKVLSEWTLYGLPMWKIGGAFTNPSPVAIGLASPTGGSPAGAGLAGPVAPDSIPQPSVDLTVGQLGDQPAAGVLTPTDTGNGTYYQQNGNTIAVQYRPVQPSVVEDVTRPGHVAHGVLITGAESVDKTNFEPYYANPVLDQSDATSSDPTGDAVFPTSLARVANPVNADGSTSSTMTLAAGQFRRDSTAAPGVGTERLFTRLDTTVNYADPSVTDFDAPAIVRSQGSVVGRTVGFTIRTAPDATRVYVLYKVLGGNDWNGVDLVKTGTDPVDGSAIWTGGVVLPTTGLTIEFLGEAADAAGNVAYTVNKTDDFLATPPSDCSVGSTISPSSTLTPSGWYVAPNGLTVSFSDPTVAVSLDGGAPAAVPAGGLTVSGDGVHQLKAQSATSSCSIIVPIDTKGPSVTATLDPLPNAGGWNAGNVNVDIKGVDPGGSGVKSVNYSVGGGSTASVDGDTAIVPITAKGATVITSWAVDAAGNVGSTVTTTVNIDGNPPTVTSVVSPTPVNGWNRAPVTVQVTASDAETGVREIDTTTGTDPPVVTLGSSASVQVSAQGVTTVGYTAIDNAGNQASGSTVVRVDTGLPSISITSPPTGVTLGATATAGFTCSDAVSGVASCTATVTGSGVNQTVLNGGALPTSTGGQYTLTVTSTDVAGNSVTATRTYTVTYGVCLLYDPTSPKPGGSTFPIKFQLCDATGKNLSASGIPVAATFIDGTLVPPPDFVGSSNLGFLFRYDPQSKGYIYNLNTTGIPIPPANHYMAFTVNGVDAQPVYRLPFTLK